MKQVQLKQLKREEINPSWLDKVKADNLWRNSPRMRELGYLILMGNIVPDFSDVIEYNTQHLTKLIKK